MYPINSGQQTVCLADLPGSAAPNHLIFIVRLQRVPCPSERIDNLAIAVDLLAMLQAIVGTITCSGLQNGGELQNAVF